MTEKNPLATPPKTTTRAPKPYTVGEPTKKKADRGPDQTTKVPVQKDVPGDSSPNRRGPKDGPENSPAKQYEDKGPTKGGEVKAEKPAKTSTRKKSDVKEDKKQEGNNVGKTASETPNQKVSTDEVLGKVRNAETEIHVDKALQKEAFKTERETLQARYDAGDINKEHYDSYMAQLDEREKNNTPSFVRNRSVQ